MTIPVSQNTNVTRADVAGTFKTQITDVVNAISKWRTESNPAGTNTYVTLVTTNHSYTPVDGFQTVTVTYPILNLISVTARAYVYQDFGESGTYTTQDIQPTGISVSGSQVSFTFTLGPGEYFIPGGPHTIRYNRVSTSSTAGAPIIDPANPPTPAALSSALLAGNTVTSSPAASDLTLGNISLSAVQTLLENTARVLSRARRVRLIKRYRATLSGYTPLTTAYDETEVAHLSSAYQLASTGVTPLASGNLDASNFNTFVDQLEAAVTAHRNSTLTFTETWCHSSCHSNHSSRGRR